MALNKLVEEIINLDADVARLTSEQKQDRIKLDAVIEKQQAYDAVQELTDSLAHEKQRLKSQLLEDARYIDLKEEMAGRADYLKDIKHTLGQKIAAYKTNTGEDHVPLNEKMGQKIIISGKLGKPELIQTSITSALKD